MWPFSIFYVLLRKQGQNVPIKNLIIAFVKERFNNAVEIDILGIVEGYSSLQIWPPPKKIFQGRNY